MLQAIVLVLGIAFAAVSLVLAVVAVLFPLFDDRGCR